ncbi:MAG: flavodoxin family protein [Syntrophaceae bacterium]|nr:flavodoxin family protein [Syntrophaceae bacterium]
MKVIAFNGSPRKDGNTAILIETVFAELNQRGIETELIPLANREIRGCIACMGCAKAKDRHCAVRKDAANEFIDHMLAADGIILGSPSYFQDITAEMKALIDRAGFVARSNDRMFKHKVGAAVAAMRRSGAAYALNSMNQFFLANEMVIAGRALGIGGEKGDIRKDEEGMGLARSLGQRMAWILQKLHA